MFTLLIIFVVVLALLAVMSLINGPGLGFGARRGRTIIIERERPTETVVEREVPRRRRVVEREYEV